MVRKAKDTVVKKFNFMIFPRVHIMAIKYWEKLLLFGIYAILFARLLEYVVVANKQFISRCWNLIALGGIAMAYIARFHIVRKM